MSTIIARRLADPAPEGMIEGADFGVAERKGDFRQRQSLVFQEVQRQRLAHVVLQVGLGLDAQAGEERLRKVAREAGFSNLRRTAQTPVNLILELTP